MLANAITDPLISGVPIPSITPLSAPKSISIGMAALQERMIDSFRELADNWDGYSALAIKELTIENAKHLLQRFNFSSFALDPSITPHPNGIITFEWDSILGEAYLEVGQSLCCAYIAPAVGKPIYWTGTVEKTPVEAIVGAIQAIIFPQFGSSQSVTVPRLRYASAS